MSPPLAVWPARRVVQLGELGLLGSPLSEGAGESLGVYPLPREPGWLVKHYQRTCGAADEARLDWLIQLPEHATSADRDMIQRHTSWPVARVKDSFGATVGVVLPEAPNCFRAGGTGDFMEVDVLAKPDATLARRGMPVPTPDDRLAICASIAAIGVTLERQSLVYSDWSYSNAFWSLAERSAYVIDIDGIGYREKPNLCQPNWQDPLTPSDQPADGYTDRYRLGLLVARCLTGERELPAVLHALTAISRYGFGVLLLDVLLADDRHRRPPISALHAALVGLPYLRVPVDRMPLPAMAPPVSHQMSTPGPAVGAAGRPPALPPGWRPPAPPPGWRPPAPPPGWRPPTSQSTAPVRSGAATAVTVVLITLAVWILLLCMAAGI